MFVTYNYTMKLSRILWNPPFHNAAKKNPSIISLSCYVSIFLHCIWVFNGYLMNKCQKWNTCSFQQNNEELLMYRCNPSFSLSSIRGKNGIKKKKFVCNCILFVSSSNQSRIRTEVIITWTSDENFLYFTLTTLEYVTY